MDSSRRMWTGDTDELFADEEVWVGTREGKYIVSNKGRIFSANQRRLVSGYRNKAGYQTVGCLLAHRLIYAAFFPLQEAEVVHHKNGNKQDNNIANLTAMSRKDHSRECAHSGDELLPADTTEIVHSYRRGEITAQEAVSRAGRSFSWLWMENGEQEGKLIEPDAHLSEDQRLQAQQDASAGLETFWLKWPGHRQFEVSNLGGVRYTRTKKRIRLNPASNKIPYPKVYKAGFVHQAVALLYVGPKPSTLHLVRHTPDPDPTNNTACNLQWGLAADNACDTVEHGRSLKGSKHPRTALTERDVEEGLKQFEADPSMGFKGLADRLRLKDCSSATRIVEGLGWAHVKRPEGIAAAREKVGRVGGKHHLSSLNDDLVSVALKQYVEGHRSSVWFAKHLGISQITAHQILSGLTWKHIPRPAGFQYPWPDAATMNKRFGGSHGCAKLDEDAISAVFTRIVVQEFSSVKEVQEALGVSKGITYGILRGDSWTHVPRPEGFQEAAEQMRKTRKK